MRNYIPQDDAARKAAPMFRGLLGYFPAALFEVAAHSLDSDRKHNGGNPDGPQWSRGKSADHEDTIIRHLIDAGKRRLGFIGTLIGLAPKGSSAKDARRYHLRCIAWRALALLQEDCEADGAAPGVSSVFPAAVDRLKDKLESMQALHPAQKLAIEAFKVEQSAAAPQPSLGHPGANEVFAQLQAARAADRFAALRGSDEEQQNPPRRVFRVYRKADGGRSGTYPHDYDDREACEREIRGAPMDEKVFKMHRAAYEIREEDE